MKKGNNKAGDHRITKMRLVREVNNCMAHNYYYEVRFRVYSDEHHYWKGNFIVWFDIDEVAEYFSDKERFSKKDIREYADECAWSFLSMAPTVGITRERMKPFYDECRKSIENYNNGVRAAA